MFFRMALVLVFCIGFIGCTEPNEFFYTEPNEFFDNDGTTYTVVTYGNKSVDDYLNQSSLALQYLEIDKSGKANKIFINIWGEFTVTGINEEGASLEGKFSLAGPLIDTAPLDFVAMRGIKK